jgi:hypothetical protein
VLTEISSIPKDKHFFVHWPDEYQSLKNNEEHLLFMAQKIDIFAIK